MTVSCICNNNVSEIDHARNDTALQTEMHARSSYQMQHSVTAFKKLDVHLA
jgi:hypothetical protein